MAKLWTTGPVLMYAGVGGSASSRSILFLGTGEEAPEINLHREYEPVRNDLSGTVLPMDETYEGQEAMVSVVMNRFNWLTLLRCQTASEANFGSLTPGSDVAGAIGSLMAQEGQTFPLYCVFPYATRASMATMPLGYRFWSAKMIGPDNIKGGTRNKKIHCQFKCMRSYTASTNPLSGPAVGGTPGLGAGFSSVGILYDFNVTGVPAID